MERDLVLVSSIGVGKLEASVVKPRRLYLAVGGVERVHCTEPKGIAVAARLFCNAWVDENLWDLSTRHGGTLRNYSTDLVGS